MMNTYRYSIGFELGRFELERTGVDDYDFPRDSDADKRDDRLRDFISRMGDGDYGGFWMFDGACDCGLLCIRCRYERAEGKRSQRARVIENIRVRSHRDMLREQALHENVLNASWPFSHLCGDCLFGDCSESDCSESDC
jgi:hypothetical protein